MKKSLLCTLAANLILVFNLVSYSVFTNAKNNKSAIPNSDHKRNTNFGLCLKEEILSLKFESNSALKNNANIVSINQKELINLYRKLIHKISVEKKHISTYLLFSVKPSESNNHLKKHLFDLSINGLSVASTKSEFISLSPSDVGEYKLEISSETLIISNRYSFLEFIYKILQNKGSLNLAINQNAKPVQIKELFFKVLTSDCYSGNHQGQSSEHRRNILETKIDSISPNTSLTNSTSAIFSFSSNHKNASFLCQMDNSEPLPCSSPQSYTALSNSQHTFRVYSKLNNRKRDHTPAVYTWTVDALPPKVDIIAQPTLTKNNFISIVFQSTEEGTTSCSLDAEEFSECSSPLTLNNLSEGAHTIRIHSIDKAGNKSVDPSSFAWTIDLTAPEVFIDTKKPTNEYTFENSMSVSFSSNETSSFECSLDHTPFESCSSPHNISNLTEGNHLISIKAIDLAGNPSSPIHYNWTVDTTKPNIKANQILPQPGLSNAKKIFVEFEINETAVVRCQFDQEPSQVCVSPFEKIIGSEGVHNLILVAMDKAGNSSDPTTISWTIDFTLPGISFGKILPSASSFINTNNISLEIINTEVSDLTMSIDGEPDNAVTSPISVKNLSDGSHQLVFKARDLAGNLSDPLVHEFTVDTIAPVLSFSRQSIGAITKQNLAIFEFSSSEITQIQCQLDGAGFSLCQSPLTLTGLAEGNHLLEISALDQANNRSSTLSHSWSLDMTPPSLTSVTLSQVSRNSFNAFLSSSESNSTYLCSLDNLEFNECTSPFEIKNLSVGNHNLRVRAVDLAGNEDSTGSNLSFSVLEPIKTIFSSAIPNESIIKINNIQIQFSANQPGGTFFCRMDQTPFSLCQSPIQYSELTDGVHQFEVYAVDQFGEKEMTSTKYHFQIDTTPLTLETSITNITPNSNLINTSTISFSFSSNSMPSQFLCTMDYNSPQVCSSPFIYGFLSDGVHQFKVQARDSLGRIDNIGATYNFTIDTTLPQLNNIESSVSSLTNQTQATFQFQSNESAQYYCQLNGSAFSLCSSPTLYSNLSDGNYTIGVQAVDKAGNYSALKSYSWSVDTTPPQTTAAINNFVGSTISFNLFSSEENSSFLCSIDGSPFYTCNSSIEYVLLLEGDHTFSARAKDQAGNIDPTGISIAFTIKPLCSLSVPIISNLSASNITQTTANIQWQTDVDSTTSTSTTNPLTSITTQTQDNTLTRSHSAFLSNLIKNTVYSVRAISSNCAGTTTSAELLFRTSR